LPSGQKSTSTRWRGLPSGAASSSATHSRASAPATMTSYSALRSSESHFHISACKIIYYYTYILLLLFDLHASDGILLCINFVFPSVFVYLSPIFYCSKFDHLFFLLKKSLILQSI
jgi:hypothetical protein